MQVLVDINSKMILGKGIVTKGIFDADPSRELYKVEDGESAIYAVTEGFEPYEVGLNIPEDYYNYSYTLKEGFVYHEPPKTDEEIRAELEKKVADLESALAEIYKKIM